MYLLYKGTIVPPYNNKEHFRCQLCCIATTLCHNYGGHHKQGRLFLKATLMKKQRGHFHLLTHRLSEFLFRTNLIFYATPILLASSMRSPKEARQDQMRWIFQGTHCFQVENKTDWITIIYTQPSKWNLGQMFRICGHKDIVESNVYTTCETTDSQGMQGMCNWHQENCTRWPSYKRKLSTYSHARPQTIKWYLQQGMLLPAPL